MITVTFIISIVVSKGAPPGTLENMDLNNSHALPKVGARKNTQVTFTRKNVNRANRKLVNVLLCNAGVAAPCTTTGSATNPAGTRDGVLRISRIAFSTHK